MRKILLINYALVAAVGLALFAATRRRKKISRGGHYGDDIQGSDGVYGASVDLEDDHWDVGADGAKGAGDFDDGLLGGTHAADWVLPLVEGRGDDAGEEEFEGDLDDEIKNGEIEGDFDTDMDYGQGENVVEDEDADVVGSSAVQDEDVGTSHGFPNDDVRHASCHLTVTLPETSCVDAKAETAQLVDTNVNTSSESKGQYSIHDQGDDWIWSTRLTERNIKEGNTGRILDRKYTDDQIFEFVESSSPTSCEVRMRSRSQQLSYNDYGVNYCNMWNIVSRITGYDSTSAATTDPSSAGNCKPDKNLPTNPVTTCGKYYSFIATVDAML